MPLVAVQPVCLADNVALSDPVDELERRFHAVLPGDIAHDLLAELVFLGRVDVRSMASASALRRARFTSWLI